MLEASSLGYHGAGKMADDALAQARPSGWNLEQGLPLPCIVYKWCLLLYDPILGTGLLLDEKSLPIWSLKRNSQACMACWVRWMFSFTPKKVRYLIPTSHKKLLSLLKCIRLSLDKQKIRCWNPSRRQRPDR